MSTPALSTRPPAPAFRASLALALPAPAPTVLTGRLVPDDLWHLAKEAIPPTPKRPQGGGQRRLDDREVLAAIVFVAGSGCSWRRLPPVFGASWQTVHRRFTEWSAAGLWDFLCTAAERRAAVPRSDWTLTVCRRIRARAAASAASAAPSASSAPSAPSASTAPPASPASPAPPGAPGVAAPTAPSERPADGSPPAPPA
ncbi:transposase, partial [Streptomyces sp. URMC 126]|uniref:transposase n=1 Tax=Streptomyces sp. URMC 126 TaxID=3423401 RepID=UPI003F1D17CD